MPGTLQIVRVPHLCYGTNEFDIFVDSLRFGSIANGESATLQIEPGRHEIFAKILFWKSKTILLDITDDTIMELECGMPPFMVFVRSLILSVIQVVIVYFIVRSPDSLAAHVCVGAAMIVTPIALFIGTRPGQYIYLKERNKLNGRE